MASKSLTRMQRIARNKINKQKKAILKNFLLPTASLVCGLVLILSGVFYASWQKSILSFDYTPAVTPVADIQNNKPIKIFIPSSQINLNIEEGSILNGMWEISERSATHLKASANPNEDNNIVIYGHNKNEIFGKLDNTKVNDNIFIKTQGTKTFTYKVIDKKTVSPQKIDEVLPTDSEILTVYTCTGLFDSQRLVIKAIPHVYHEIVSWVN